MKIIKFPEDSDGDVINRAYKKVFEQHNIPEEQRKEARNWCFVRHEVSRLMTYKVTGRALPIINRGFNPPREIIRLAFKKDYTPHTYPMKCKNDKQKFAYLKVRLLRNEIDLKTFKEYAEVLDIKEKQVKQAIKQSLKILFEV